MKLLDLLLLFITLASCLQLLVYRRDKAHYKPALSVIAYLIIVSYGGLSVALLTGMLSSTQIPALVIVGIFVLSSSVFYCAGNVSMILKLPRRIQHVINFR